MPHRLNKSFKPSLARYPPRFTMSFQATFQPLTCVIEVNYGYEPANDGKKKQLDAESILKTFFLASGNFAPGSVALSELEPSAYYPAATLLRDLPGIRPAPDRGVSRTRPAVGFTDYPNTVMNGCSYKPIPKMERSACQAACAVDPACQCYSHNKVTQACELKHMLTARRLDPLWTSGAPSAGPAPGRSVRADAMAFLPRVLFKSPRIEGKLIDEAKVESPEACWGYCCWDRCGSDPMCLAVEEVNDADGGEVCRRFSEVTGLREAPVDQGDVRIRIKKQQ
jgi:hypothetical protein